MYRRSISSFYTLRIIRTFKSPHLEKKNFSHCTSPSLRFLAIRQVIPILKGLILSSLFLICVATLSSCDASKTKNLSTTDSLELKYSVLKTLPHNTKAFTEGLLFHNNKLLESTGLNNQSWIAEVNLLTGEHDKKVTLPEQYFGEGIAVLNGKVYQLTYQEKVGFIYDAETYEQIGEFKYQTQGWGLTHNGTHLIMSDGTNKLYFLDTTYLKPVKTLRVTDPSGAKVTNLNELEYINDFIYANVHETSTIVKIDPSTGAIAGRLDLSALSNETKRMDPHASELNGIAFDATANTLLVTGKFWPKTYAISIH